MAEDQERSPQVRNHGWGYVEVDGVGRLRDAKLWPGGGRAWDWNETGTRHQPGIQPADVAELLEHAPEIVVLSKGRQLRLETCSETLDLLTAHHLEVAHEETGAAIDEYNRLAGQGRRVAALLHTTC
jgi:hypothetical protein